MADGSAAFTILELLAGASSAATAITSPGGVPLTFDRLYRLMGETKTALGGRGIGPNDRVAIVLDNGPEMAAAFLGVASCATAAPLNPSYRAEEFEFYLTDLRAQLLIVS